MKFLKPVMEPSEDSILVRTNVLSIEILVSCCVSRFNYLGNWSRLLAYVVADKSVAGHYFHLLFFLFFYVFYFVYIFYQKRKERRVSSDFYALFGQRSVMELGPTP